MAITNEQSQENTLKQEALTVTQQSAMVRIVDQSTYNLATSLLLGSIIPFRKKWQEYWGPLKKAAWDAHKAVMDKFNEGDQPAEAAEREIKHKILAWDREQERIRQEQQRKAQEEAERKEREDRLAAAIAAETSGATEEEVEEIVSAPVQAIAAPVAPTYARAAGVSTAENWKCVVTDMKKLCLAVAKGKVSVEYVLPNQTALNARARADKLTMNIPGCMAKNEGRVSGRIR